MSMAYRNLSQNEIISKWNIVYIEYNPVENWQVDMV